MKTAQNKRSLRYRLSKLTIYLPMLVMGMLALASFWLVRNAPQVETTHQQPKLLHEPDYTLTDFSARSFNEQGKLSSEIFGLKALRFADDKSLSIEQVRIRNISPEGRVFTAHANKGSSNADRSYLKLYGDAVVLQQPFEGTSRLEFQGDELQMWPNEDRVRSDFPVVILRGSDRLTGDHLDYNKKQQQLQMQGRIRTILQPSATK